MQSYQTNVDLLSGRGAYSMAREEKSAFLTAALTDLTKHHLASCGEYAKMLSNTGFDISNVKSYLDLPFLPVRLFKLLSLKSVAEEEIIKTMTSSGTTGQAVSRIFLDKQTAANQQKTLVKLVSEFLGSQRLPMLILDTSAVLKDRNLFSARGAGILGFSIFASDKIYALNEQMELDFDAVKAFLEKHAGKNILLFGFTFMVWKHFYGELIKRKERLDLSKGVLFHGGGWKKLISERVSNEEFKRALNKACGISSVHDYYGMVEQTGCIYIECEEGHLHCSNYSDVIIRRPQDFSVADLGEKGIIQVVSILPYSYCGHSLLTEDEGIILGEDDCKCGRKGKYFKILGRIANAEIRGCGDTYAVSNSK